MKQKLFFTLIISLTVTLGVTKFLLGEYKHALNVSMEALRDQKHEQLIRVTEIESAYAKRLALVTGSPENLIGYVEDSRPIFVRSTVETAFNH